MVDVSEEVLAKARTWLLNKAETWKNGVSCGSYTDINWLDDPVITNTACHAWLSGAYSYNSCGRDGYEDGKNAKTFLVANPLGHVRTKNNANPESVDRLVLWMARESPFSEYVLNRDDTEGLTKGGVLLLCGPGGLNHVECLWFCKVLRLAVECYGSADVFAALVDAGVDGMLAIAVAHYFQKSSSGYNNYEGVGHQDVMMGSDFYALLTRDIYKRSPTTRGLFSEPVKVTERRVIKSNVFNAFGSPVKKSDGWGGYVSSSGGVADLNELARDVLELQANLLKDIPEEFRFGPVTAVPIPKAPDRNTVFLEVDM